MPGSARFIRAKDSCHFAATWARTAFDAIDGAILDLSTATLTRLFTRKINKFKIVVWGIKFESLNELSQSTPCQLLRVNYGPK